MSFLLRPRAFSRSHKVGPSNSNSFVRGAFIGQTFVFSSKPISKDQLDKEELNYSTKKVNEIQAQFGSFDLEKGNQSRFFIMEGVLKELNGNLKRDFKLFLFNDLLVCHASAKLNQQYFRNKHVSAVAIPDDGDLFNAFQLICDKNVFILMTNTDKERDLWVENIKFYSGELERKGWQIIHWDVPKDDNGQALECMICQKTRFSLSHPRRTCRKCTAQICGNCSKYKILVSSLSLTQPMRVCSSCYSAHVEGFINPKADNISLLPSFLSSEGKYSDSDSDPEIAGSSFPCEPFTKYHRSRRVHGV
ncbi:Pleckstrin y domain-containing F member 2 [Basidiobolus ranarum]|uniref:Pleckstrin y domain-containing F member 2 n=1 Tax=Basidiobolus ranarum TaxID=34480 RepID=A0ABR2W9A5_9FUNG